MSSLRHKRREACEGKHPYKTLEEALGAARAHHRKHDGEWLSSYRCHFCHQFHIGHFPHKVRQAIAAKRRKEAP